MAMFPLNSVLFPYMPLRLRVFEERYLIMLAELLKSEDARFGVVLIERGREVGCGEECFSVGTIAQITQLSRASSPRTYGHPTLSCRPIPLQRPGSWPPSHPSMPSIN